jgi:ABC-type Fe3+-hydroxamate transport system substrate-binding protein
MRAIQTILAAAIAAMLSVAVSSAEAGQRRDRVYADSFGNLIVDSAAGYKRIIVGQGSQIKELSKYLNRGQPSVVEYQDENIDTRYDNYLDEDDYRVFNNRGVFNNQGVFHN